MEANSYKVQFQKQLEFSCLDKVHVSGNNKYTQGGRSQIDLEGLMGLYFALKANEELRKTSLTEDR